MTCLPRPAVLDNPPTVMNDGAPLTRRELYNLVWSRPMMHVAAQFGVTGPPVNRRTARPAGNLRVLARPEPGEH